MATKYALILPDGVVDQPHPQLGQRTPLEYAETPNLDWISVHGRQGTVVTVPEGLPADNGVALLSVLGYDPAKFYPGRAPLEVLARDIPLTTRDVVFCCNLVTVVDGRMEDFSAGRIGQPEAEQLISHLNERIGSEQVMFYVGRSFQHWMVLRDAPDCEVRCTRPQDIVEEPIRGHLPTGRGSETVRRVMERSAQLLADHEVNQVRQSLGENPATQVWLWGPGRKVHLPRFSTRYRLRGAMIGGVELARGVSKGIGWDWLEVPGATGLVDTDFAAKGRAAVRALDEYDLVAVHVNAAQDAGCQGDLDAKAEAVARIDQQIVAAVLDKLRSFEHFRILVVPAYSAPVAAGAGCEAAAPFCMAGREVVSVLRRAFCERNAQTSDLHVERGHELMEYFLKC